MTVHLSRRAVLAAAALALCAATPASQAQNSGPLRVILPVGAGSGVDTIMRAAQGALSKALGGQAVVIENLPGAGGITGTQALVKGPPAYDSLADITPISVVGSSPFVLLVNPAKLPVKNAKDLQAMLKARPDAYNYGSSGNGTIIHLAGEMFVDAAGVVIKHIPYKGMGPMLADLIGGQVEMGVAAVPAAQGHMKSGALTAIGVMGRQRVASLPNLPTLIEQGFADVDIAGWFAVVGPAKLPAVQVRRLHEAVVAAFNDPEVKAAMARQDNSISPGTPEAAVAFFKTEQERYARLVKKANITLD
ncbi:MAG: ABC transporter substrate-binding protein [Burkholderiales bacterium PBB5]|nr:MAG: ABC transporter substrate-binding protein [Burkholderiales bacterium PBB5]